MCTYSKNSKTTDRKLKNGGMMGKDQRAGVGYWQCRADDTRAATAEESVRAVARHRPAPRAPERGVCWELHGAKFFKMSSLEQRLSRIEEKLKQENEEARRRIDLSIDMSPQRSRPRPSECPAGVTGVRYRPERRGDDRGEGVVGGYEGCYATPC